MRNSVTIDSFGIIFLGWPSLPTQPNLTLPKGWGVHAAPDFEALKSLLNQGFRGTILTRFGPNAFSLADYLEDAQLELPVGALGEQAAGADVSRFMSRNPAYRYFEITDTQGIEAWLHAQQSPPAQQNRQSIRDYLFQALNTSIIGVVHSHWDGRILEANQTFLDMLGYTRQDLQDGLLDWRNLTPPEYRQKGDKAFKQLIEQGSVPSFEKQYFRKDGSRVDALIGIIGSFPQESDYADTCLVFVLDISQVKANERELHKSQASLLRSQRVAKLGSWLYDAHEHNWYASEEFYHILGAPPNTAFDTKAKYLEYVHPEERELWSRTLDELLAGKSEIALEYRIIRPDGQIRKVRSLAEASFDERGKLLQVCGIIQDITESAQTQEALMLLTAQQEALLDNIPDMVWLKDCNFKYITSNDVLAKFLGCSKEEVKGKRLEDFVTGDFAKSQREMDEQVLETGQRLSREDCYTYPDGRKIWLESIKSPIFDGEGNVIGITGIGRDITQRKEYEEALQSSHELLEKKVIERTNELQAANQTLKENEKLRSTFISSLTHDLKTPLIAQKHMLELLQEQCKHEAGKIAFLCHGLIENNENLLDMVSKLLETYQYAEGKIILHAEWFNLYTLVEECLDTLGALASNKGIELFNRVPADFEPIRADRSLLKRVLINLLGNALENIPHGCHAEVRATQTPDKVEIEVADNGNGIEPEFLPHIFDRYGPRGSRRHKLGSGLGLFICKTIVELHQGSISAISTPKQGATFLIRLPKPGSTHL